jgi:hypothetical protein
MGATVVAWSFFCVLHYQSLAAQAAAAPPGAIEEHARSGQFQVLNVAAGYLPVLLVFLAGALALELATFWVVRRLGRTTDVDAEVGT